MSHEKLGEHPSPKEKPHITKPGVGPIDTSAIKPGPAADNPKPLYEKPQNTDADKEPEPPTNTANPNVPAKS